MIIKRPSVSRKVLKASLMMYLSFGDMLGPCLGGLGGSLGRTVLFHWAHPMRSPFACFPFIFFCFHERLTIIQRGGGENLQQCSLFWSPLGWEAAILDSISYLQGHWMKCLPTRICWKCHHWEASPSDLGPEKLQPLRSPQAPQLNPGWEPNFFKEHPSWKNGTSP